MLAVALLTSISAFADDSKIISIIWPWSMGDPIAAYSRSLIEELNGMQTKYKFVYENKPGAGGTIAARYVTANPSHTILSGSTAFFVRPNFYPNESYKVSQFTPIMTQCANPMILVSKKYKSISAIDKSAKINIGISGMGATSHLLSMQFKERFPNTVPVAYKSTSEAMVDVIGSNLDISIGFITEVEGFLDKGDAYAIGISGKKSIKNIPTLESQGFAQTSEIMNMFHLTVSKDMPLELQKDMRELFVAAAKTNRVQESYKLQYCEPSNLTMVQTENWYKRQVALWAKLSEGIVLDK